MRHSFDLFVLHEDGVMLEGGFVNAEGKYTNGMTALLRAACERNWIEVKKLILRGADP